MAFRTAEFSHLARFNSATSSNFLDNYESYVDETIRNNNARPKSQCIAPSGMYCLLQQWFRLRGAQPDEIKQPDRGLNFTAEIGTACHEIIQNNLSTMLGSDWLSVPEHLKSIYSDSEYSTEASGFETRVQLNYPPVRFAVDGLININDTKYLLEIKTSDRGSFEDLTNPKAKHIDQIKTYCALLHLNKAIVLYQDRMYGDLKCFEVDIPQYECDDILTKMKELVRFAEANLAPEGLPKGDARCSSNMCPYYKKCKDWRV